MPATFINYAKTHPITAPTCRSGNALGSAKSPSNVECSVTQGPKPKDEQRQHNEDERKPRPLQSLTARAALSFAHRLGEQLPQVSHQGRTRRLKAGNNYSRLATKPRCEELGRANPNRALSLREDNTKQTINTLPGDTNPSQEHDLIFMQPPQSKPFSSQSLQQCAEVPVPHDSSCLLKTPSHLAESRASSSEELVLLHSWPRWCEKNLLSWGTPEQQVFSSDGGQRQAGGRDAAQLARRHLHRDPSLCYATALGHEDTSSRASGQPSSSQERPRRL